MLLVPVIVVSLARGSAQFLVLRVMELYQRIVRSFQRCKKAYGFVAANFTHAQLRPPPDRSIRMAGNS
jgi:hypothetical protein